MSQCWSLRGYILFALLIGSLCCSGETSARAALLTCPADAYFEPSTLQCAKCPDYAFGMSGTCQCRPGYASHMPPEDTTPVCIDCAARNQAVSLLKAVNGSQYCVPCGGDRSLDGLVDSTFDADMKLCVCPSGHTLVEQLGARLLAAQMCAPCPTTACIDCSFPYEMDPDGRCVCTQAYTMLADGTCAPSSISDAVSEAAKGTTTNFRPPNVHNTGEQGKTVVQHVISTGAVAAAIRCRMGNMTSCSFLANMCVLMLYSQRSTPCALYLDILRHTPCTDLWCERPSHLPWLYYKRSSADILKPFETSFQPIAQQPLEFVLSVFQLDGTWSGFKQLTEEFNTCEGDYHSALSYYQAGNTRRMGCGRSWKHFLEAEQSHFFELYFLNPQNRSELVPVPVLLDYTNFKFEPNKMSDAWLYRPAADAQGNPAVDGYRRRFYLYDNAGGLSPGSVCPSYVTTTRSISLIVSSDPSYQHHLMTPLFVLQYVSADVGNAEADVKCEEGTAELPSLTQPASVATVQQEVRAYYLPNRGITNDGVLIAMIVLLVVCLPTAWLRTYGWMRRRQYTMLDAAALFRFFIYYCDHVGTLFTVAVAIASWYTFLGFKMQHWLTLAMDDATNVHVMMYVAVATKGVAVLYRLVEQCNADYFVIDWERSKGQLFRENTPIPVSMWRSTFLANELNELQALRHCHPLLTMVIILLFLQGFGCINFSASAPSASRHAPPQEVSFSLLRIAVSTFFWFVVGLGIYVLEHQIFYRFITVHPLQAFVDLCSVSNISVVVLLEPLWGFYIHGESIHAFADVCMADFQQNLHLESQGNLPVRGLGGQKKCQAFEVYLGMYMRHYLYVCYTEMQLEHQRALGKVPMPVRASRWHFLEFLGGFSRKSRVYSEAALAIKERINDAFQQSVRRAESSLLAKFVLQRWINFPPNIMYMNGPQNGDRGEKDLFFFDEVQSYGRCFLYGMDLDLFILYMMLYTTIDASLHNVYAACVVTYVVEMIIGWYRMREGLANMSKKTLIDDRFFI